MLRALLFGFVAGSAASPGLYGLLCLALVVDTVGLTNRWALGGRSVLFFLLSSAAARMAWRRLPRGLFHKGLASVAAILCVAVLWLVWAEPLWNPEDQWRKLEEVARTLDGQVGSQRWSLPKGWAHAVVATRAAEGGERHLHVLASDRWLAHAFGLDLFQLDNIRVVVGQDGRLRTAWVDYF